jgi:hypothetical protein
MTEKLRGKAIPLSVPRRLICDVLHASRRVPSVPVQRRMDLGPVIRARTACPSRPAWVAIFTKALALVARDFPQLRRAYLSFPSARLYEHPHSVASVAISREYEGEEAVFFAQMRAPERRALAALDGWIRGLKSDPIPSIRPFERALRFGRLWRPLRRALWWWGLNVSGRTRARYFGTFGVSVYSGLGVDSLHPLSPLTTMLNYGPIRPDGLVDVRLIYDHRVLDGAVVGRALGCLEVMLRETITAELRDLAGASVAWPRAA